METYKLEEFLECNLNIVCINFYPVLTLNNVVWVSCQGRIVKPCIIRNHRSDQNVFLLKTHISSNNIAGYIDRQCSIHHHYFITQVLGK